MDLGWDVNLGGIDLDVWTVLTWVVVGLVVGAIARFVLPGEDPVPFGCVGTAVVGILGSFVGGAIGNLIQQGELTFELHRSGFLGSIVGTVAILIVMRVFR